MVVDGWWVAITPADEGRREPGGKMTSTYLRAEVKDLRGGFKRRPLPLHLPRRETRDAHVVQVGQRRAGLAVEPVALYLAAACEEIALLHRGLDDVRVPGEITVQTRRRAFRVSGDHEVREVVPCVAVGQGVRVANAVERLAPAQSLQERRR